MVSNNSVEKECNDGAFGCLYRRGVEGGHRPATYRTDVNDLLKSQLSGDVSYEEATHDRILGYVIHRER